MSDKALLTYPLVKPVDAIIARILLEILTMLVVLTVFFTLLSVFSNYKIIHTPHIFLQAVFATILLSAGVGVFNAVFSMIVPAWERLWGLIKLPLLILSGIFYIPKSMPPIVQDIIYWNPLLHCVEWLRHGAYLDYDPMLNRSFVIWFSLSFLTAGLFLERIYRHTLVRS